MQLYANVYSHVKFMYEASNVHQLYWESLNVSVFSRIFLIYQTSKTGIKSIYMFPGTQGQYMAEYCHLFL